MVSRQERFTFGSNHTTGSESMAQNSGIKGHIWRSKQAIRVCYMQCSSVIARNASGYLISQIREASKSNPRKSGYGTRFPIWKKFGCVSRSMHIESGSLQFCICIILCYNLPQIRNRLQLCFKIQVIRLHKIWINFLFESIRSLYYIAVLRTPIVCQDIFVSGPIYPSVYSLASHLVSDPEPNLWFFN